MYHTGKDYSIPRAYALKCNEWVIRGVRGLRTKSEGAGEMVWAFNNEERGYGLVVSTETFEQVNELPRAQRRPDSKETSGPIFVLPDKKSEASWRYERFERRVVDVMDCIGELKPGKQLCCWRWTISPGMRSMKPMGSISTTCM